MHNRNKMLLTEDSYTDIVEISENFAAAAGAFGSSLTMWAKMISGLVAAGTLTKTQGIVIGAGVPALLSTGAAKGQDITRAVKQFAHDVKAKREINPTQIKQLTQSVIDATKELPKGKRQHVAKLMKAHQDAENSGDKNKILKAQRDVAKYVNRQTSDSEGEQRAVDRATSPRRASSAEKRLAPAGATHAGFGRWVDRSGNTLGYTRHGKWVPRKTRI